jgi:hypothetical protein
MRGEKLHDHGDTLWFLIPADRRHAWWFHLTDAGQCKILGQPKPAAPAYATPILFPAICDHDPLLPRGDHQDFLVVPGSLEAKVGEW